MTRHGLHTYTSRSGFRAGVALCAAMLAVATLAGGARRWAALPAVRSWATVFGAICLQATPFVVLGAVLAALVAALPSGWVQRLLPRRALFAIPVLGIAGTALPGCECGAVTTAAAMLHRGVPAGPAMTFALSAPSANPVVLAATAAAFPGKPALVAGRFVAGVITAIAVGGLTASGAFGRPRPHCDDHRRRASDGAGVLGHAANELVRSLGLLTLGATAAASAAVLLPRTMLRSVGTHPLLAICTLAGLSVVLCICSQADAFVARSFAGCSLSAQFAFMVVGAAVDLKVLSLQAGAFGIRFAIRVCACAFVIALVVACVLALPLR